MTWNFDLNSKIMDLEIAAHNAIRSVLPQSAIECCQFHFAQALWRKIQDLGLTVQFQDKRSPISKWLHYFLGLPLLPPNLFESTFCDYLMPDCPGEEQLMRFSDYVLNTYVDR